jgi:hypothetical protein
MQHQQHLCQTLSWFGVIWRGLADFIRHRDDCGYPLYIVNAMTYDFQNLGVAMLYFGFLR